MNSQAVYRDSSWVAQELGLDEVTVESLMERHELPGFKVGLKWLVSEEKLWDFLREEEERQAENASRESERTQGGSRVPRTSFRTQRTRHPISYRLFGTERVAPTSKELLLQVLRELSGRDATFLTRFRDEGGRKRRYVAQNPFDLYPGKPHLVRDAKEELQRGWWVGTNYSAHEIESILRKACQAAGLRWGKDLVIHRADADERKRQAMGFVGLGADPDPHAARRHDELFVRAILNETD